MDMKKSLSTFLSALLIVVVSSYIMSNDALADVPTVKDSGTLTSVENDGTVIIDEKGYKVDPSVVVIDRKGKNVLLRSISLPSAVRFEYIYAKTGFIIVSIEEVKNKEVKKKRSPQ
ncbi:MAG: hypothetical protein C4581_13795 [Nitrospiraceae bacterium]|nr:MAG: hypothetical protein C4581_13795 [Nitrospiraceae bacterium]